MYGSSPYIFGESFQMERVRVSRYLYFRNTKQICEGEAARLFIDPFAVQEVWCKRGSDRSSYFVTKVRRYSSLPLRREFETSTTAGAAMAALG